MLNLVCLEIELILMQDRVKVCAEHTIGSEIISVYLEIVLILTHGSCLISAKHNIGSEIILDAPYGTPR
jgi:hypothetical protein